MTDTLTPTPIRKTQKVSLPLLKTIEATVALLPHVSKDDVTPVLTTIYVEPDEGGVKLLASDRYTAAIFPVPHAKALEGRGEKPIEQEHSAGFMIPRAAAEWISKIVPKSLRSGEIHYVVTLEELKDSTMVSIQIPGTDRVERSQEFNKVSGNFPPVAKLFPDETFPLPDKLSISLEQISKVASYVGKYHKTMPLTFTGTNDKEANPNKLAPIFTQVGDLRVLLQPNFLVNN